MEQTQLETIDTICQNIQLMASILQEYVRQKKNSSCFFLLASQINDLCFCHHVYHRG